MKNIQTLENSKSIPHEKQPAKSRAKTLRMRGLRVPRILVWLLGLFHGKILHTGGLDPETQKISSAYVSGQVKRFSAACVNRREAARARLEQEWIAVDEAIQDFKSISSSLATPREDKTNDKCSSAEARAIDAAHQTRSVHKAQLLAIEKRLTNTINAVCAEIHSVNDQMEATADLLQSIFACYGHGMLMKPVHPRNLPEVSFTDCREQILKDHEVTWDTIKSILNNKEVA